MTGQKNLDKTVEMLRAYLLAKEPYIWINTTQMIRALPVIRNTINDVYGNGYQVNPDNITLFEPIPGADPVTVFDSVQAGKIVIAYNYISFINNVQIAQLLISTLRRIQSEIHTQVVTEVEIVERDGTKYTMLPADVASVIFVGPFKPLDPSIKHYVRVVDFGLPTKEEVAKVIHSLAKNNSVELDKNVDWGSVGQGLTLHEITGAAALSIATTAAHAQDAIFDKLYTTRAAKLAGSKEYKRMNQSGQRQILAKLTREIETAISIAAAAAQVSNDEQDELVITQCTEHARKISSDNNNGDENIDFDNNYKELHSLVKEILKMPEFNNIHGTIDKQYILKVKEEIINKTPGVELYHPTELDKFEYIAGLDRAKDFVSKAIKSEHSRGVLLLGVPGTGKTALAKALAGESGGMPVLKLDFGSLFGKYVGESEQRARDAISIIEAFAPCIVVVDEIEKGLSGVNSSGDSDGGTGRRVFDYFLRWLQDRTARVFVVATSNDISRLPPEMTRAERWDTVFFVDFPSPHVQDAIKNIWFKYYGVNDPKWLPPKQWTGAEIKTVARLAKTLGVSPKEAEQYVVPIIKGRAEEMRRLRDAALSSSVPADTLPKKTTKKVGAVKFNR